MTSIKRRIKLKIAAMLMAGCVLMGDAGGLAVLSAEEMPAAGEMEAGDIFVEPEEDLFAAEDVFEDLVEEVEIEFDSPDPGIDETVEETEAEMTDLAAAEDGNGDWLIEDIPPDWQEDELFSYADEEAELKTFIQRAVFEDPVAVDAQGEGDFPEEDEIVFEMPAFSYTGGLMSEDGGTGTTPEEAVSWYRSQLDDTGKIFYDIRYQHFCAERKTGVLFKEYEYETTPYTFKAPLAVDPETGEYKYSLDSSGKKQYIIDRTSSQYRTGYEGMLYEMRAAFDAFCYDHPEIFWTRRMESRFKFGGKVSTATGMARVYLKNVTITPIEAFEGAAELLDDFDSATDTVYGQVVAGSDYDGDGSVSEIEAIQGFHDYVCGTVFYDSDSLNAYYNNEEGSSLYIFTPCGAFLTDLGTGVVCEGYSRSFLLLCRKMGIPCVLVSGKTSLYSTEGHMWNAVYFEGKWRLVDTTWDDAGTGWQYKYFLCNRIAGRIDDGYLSGVSYTDTESGFTTRPYSFSFPSVGTISHTFALMDNRGQMCNGAQVNVCNQEPEVRYWIRHDNNETEPDPMIEPGCTTEGRTEQTLCSVCHGILIPGEVIPATGHLSPVTLDDVPPTCTQEGVHGKVVCGDCNEVLNPGEPIPATGHLSPVEVEDVLPTCTRTGFRNMVICADCGAVINPGEVLPMLPHTEKVTAEALEAGCTTEGHTREVVCEICGEVLEESTVIPAKGHSEQVTRQAAEADCVKEGHTREVVCADCGEVLEASTAIPAKGHKPVPELVMSDRGIYSLLVERVHCSVCGTLLKETIQRPVIAASATPTVRSAKSSGKRAVRVNWSRVSGASGYEVACSTKKKFSKCTTIRISNPSRGSVKIKGLKRKKTYYVRVRSYVVVNGVTLYSSWSKKKKVKTR